MTKSANVHYMITHIFVEYYGIKTEALRDGDREYLKSAARILKCCQS